jgi:hypothetical protein
VAEGRTPEVKQLIYDLHPYNWMDELNQFKSTGITAIGTVNQLKEFCQNVGKKWCTGIQLTPALE